MAARADVDLSLKYIRRLTGELRGELTALPPQDWDRPSNCLPWSVGQLVAHVVTSGELFRIAVERGLAGNIEPVISEVERARQIRELAAAAPAEVLDRLDRATDAMEALYERLSADELEVVCYHRRGNRSARWYVQHRLAEVAFHAWDVQRSLGRPAVFDREVAAFLLPMLLESNLPRTYRSGPGGEGRFRLTSVGGDPDPSWLLIASREQLDVQRDAGHADVTIAAPPETLALLIYGRADLLDEERQGRARIAGDRALAGRFHTVFPGP